MVLRTELPRLTDGWGTLQSRVTCSRLLRDVFGWVANISEDRDSTASLFDRSRSSDIFSDV